MDPDSYGDMTSSQRNSSPTITPSSTTVAARFEFETGRGNDGTKVLLVEWHSDSDDEPPTEQCNVEWEGKTQVLPVVDCLESSSCRRLLFWLPPDATIPATVSISRPGRQTLHAKALPAIFPPGLDTRSPGSGHRGVLHTLWATNRLVVLEEEISREAQENTESVGIEMVLKEKTFILNHFGLAEELTNAATASSPAPALVGGRSPLNSRMTEKLRGLKLSTSPEGLAPSVDLKPQSQNAAELAPIPGMVPVAGVSAMSGTRVEEEDDDADLFALPMSPRSPEMKRSPFSLS